MINWINISFQYSNIKIEQYETWQKMSFRNRMVLAGGNGLVNLSVPLEKGRGQRGLIKEVKISHHDNWQQQHWRTIESCYSRSPFFEFYRDGVRDLIFKKQDYLFDLNMDILLWLQKVLKNGSTVSLTETYQKEYLPPNRDLRNYFLPKNYREITGTIQYTQVFEDRIGFQPNLSILDCLFCCGPNAKSLLKDCKSGD